MIDLAVESTTINARMFRFVLGCAWLVIACWMIGFAVLGARSAALVFALGGLIFAPASLWLHLRGRALAASYVFIVTGVAMIVAGCLLGSPRAGFESYFLAGLPIVVLVFSAERVRDQVLAALILCGGWIFTLLTSATWAEDHLSAAISSDTLQLINFVGSFALIFVMLHSHLVHARGLRTRSMEALARSRETEELLAQTVHHMREGVLLMTKEGLVIRFNQAIKDWIGRTPDLGRPLDYPALQIFDERGRRVSLEDLPSRQAALTGEPQARTLRLVRADGTPRWIIVNAVAFSADLGAEDTHILVTALDVTELKKSEDLLSAIVNTTPDWIFIKDRAHRYLKVNDSYAAALRRTPAEILGKTDLELGFPEEIVRGDAALGIRGFWADDKLVMDSGRILTFEHDPATIDGEPRIFHTVKAPLFEAKNEPAYGVLGFSRDVTSLVEIERRLVESSKMASLGQMAGGIAHEINNPLAIIHGRCSLLLMQSERGQLDSVGAKPALEQVVATVERIAKIIRGLKTFARGGADDPFETITARALIEDAIALCAERARTLGVTIDTESNAELKLNGNPAQLAQILVNLVNNAFDAVETLPERWVHVRAKTVGRVIRITIVDAGRGIPPEIARQLMQPFFTTKPVGRGTGLGLMISRQIADHHGGRLYLDSGETHTTFALELPVAES